MKSQKLPILTSDPLKVFGLMEIYGNEEIQIIHIK